MSIRTHARGASIGEAEDMKLLVRLAAILGASLLYSLVMTNFFPTEDADIGAGLIYFAALIVVSGAWGLWDGYHSTVLPPVFVRWAVVALVVGLSGPLKIWFEEGRDVGVLLSDLRYLTPFVAGLVLAPAAVGIALGYALNSRDRSLPGNAPHHPSL
ncbi:hypothetical protein ACFV9G_00560 [Nocardioides sp. NPDC059952]|uniref:hypothetical protein n=1 Tax=Nocardioides sp. NPDC059952 TaxID=3347014 RepID=UPI00364A19D9